MAGKPQKRQNWDQELLLDDVCALLEWSRATVTALARDGWIPRPYTARSAVQGVIRKFREQRDANSKTARHEAVQIERARKLKLENDLKERKLVEFDEVILGWDVVFGEIKADIQSIAARVTDDMDVRRKIDAECRHVLDAMAERYRKASEAISTLGGIAEASEDDDAEPVGDPVEEISA